MNYRKNEAAKIASISASKPLSSQGDTVVMAKQTGSKKYGLVKKGIETVKYDISKRSPQSNLL